MMKLYIDKFKKEDGYYDEDDCRYETALDFIVIGIFKFCGCGNPKSSMEYIRDILALIEAIDLNSNGAFDEAWKLRWKNLEGFFKSRGEQYTMYYLLDKLELTEHGSSVPGWLTDKGKEVLHDLNIILEKSMPVDPINRSPINPRPA